MRKLTQFSESSTSKFSRAILRALDCGVANDLIEAMDAGRFDVLAEASVTPSWSYDPEAFRKEYLAVNLLRKYDGLPLNVDRRAVALSSFLETEEGCRLVNYYQGRNPFVPDAYRSLDESFEAIIHVAKEKIRNVLGTFNWNHAAASFGFSGGATTQHRRASGAPFYKYSVKPETTRNNALLAICAVWQTPLWRRHMEELYGSDPFTWFTIVEGSKLTTVPKSSTTDRTICIEPDMNMYVQRGIGAVIRQRLRRVGIDLNDQTRNQQLARIGSRTGSLATIDLRSASDSVSLSIVETLLPPDWFKAICLCRSEVCTLPNGVKHRLEKVSSMGNGYTFELESLIFWALTSAVVAVTHCEDRRIGIYGDDIIVHHSCADRLIGVLEYAGFQTNSQKSFVSGPFRESCGKHYFLGTDVSPFYIKTGLDKLNRKFWLYNSVSDWDPSLEGVLRYIRTSIPYRNRYYVPRSAGPEAGMIAPFDVARPKWDRSKAVFTFKALKAHRKKHRPNGAPALLQWFQAAGPTAQENFLELEKGDTVYSHKTCSVPWWD